MPMHSPPPGEAAAEDSENYFLLDTSRLEEGFEELVDEIVPKAPSSSRSVGGECDMPTPKHTPSLGERVPRRCGRRRRSSGGEHTQDTTPQ